MHMYKCTVKPPNTADLGTGAKAAVFRKRQYWESYITYKTLILDLKMGGGIGRAAVLAGAVLGGGGGLYHFVSDVFYATEEVQ